MNKIIVKKIKLFPNQEQKQELVSLVHAKRAGYNKALEIAKASRWNKKEIRQKVVAWRKETDWAQQAFAHLFYGAIDDLERAYKSFFKKQTKYPKFKKRREFDGSFRVGFKACFKLKERSIWFTKFKSGYIKLAEFPPENATSVVITREADLWFAVFTYRKEIEPIETTDELLGVDLGLTHLAICSDGEKFENRRFFVKNQKRLKRVQRRLKRKRFGSRRWQKAIKRARKLQARISRQRKDYLHKVARRIVNKKPKAVVLEDLHVKGMIKNRRLAKHIQDASWYTLRNLIEYKAKLAGIDVVIADRFFPSSQITPSGDRVKLTLDQRFVRDPRTKLWYDRDINAARNLASYGRRTRTSKNGRGCGVRPVFQATAGEASTAMVPETGFYKEGCI